jgi:uncharacterized membrane protein
MTQVSLWRLYALRATYLFVAVGLGVEIWPGIIYHYRPWELMQGVVCCVLAAVSVLAVMGLRYPLQMLPLLLFELIWKSIWLAVVAVPLWLTHQMDAQTWSTAAACLLGVIFPFVIPWRHVFENYLMKRGDRWL